jgi:hypothetical protein
LCGGIRLSLLGTEGILGILAISGPVISPLDDDGVYRADGLIEVAQKLEYPEKPCPSAPLFTINPT